MHWIATPILNVVPPPFSPKIKQKKLSHAPETVDGGEAQLIDVAADIEAPEDEEPLQSPVVDIIAAEDTKEEAKTAPSGELDDLEFWLSRTDVPTSSKTKEQPPAPAGETKPQAEATAEGEGETKRKKKREKVGDVHNIHSSPWHTSLSIAAKHARDQVFYF